MNEHILPLDFTGDENRMLAETAIGYYVIQRIVTDDGPIWLCRLFSRFNFQPLDNYMCGFSVEEAKAICQKEHEITIYNLLAPSGQALLNL